MNRPIGVPLHLCSMAVFGLVLAGIDGCDGQAAPPLKPRPKGDRKMTMVLRSAAFAEGKPIPTKYSGEGKDVSPPLEWDKVPDGTKQFALICDDPDAPTPQPWVHWMIYALPADVRALPEGVPAEPKLKSPPGTLQGKNSWPSGQTIGYRGPMPPPGHGVHHYHFKLLALDAALDLKPGLDKTTLLKATEGHILAEGRLIGTYQR
jgi:Raf kinase inhibitor-like YbhB/YbcL family protein